MTIGFWGLSPRGRGKPERAHSDANAIGSIPAWAGETKRLPAGRPRPQVYPRVGGGNRAAEHNRKVAEGLSPRGRGKPRLGISAFESPRSIPAWAGETHSRPCRLESPSVYPRVGGGNSPFLRNCGRSRGLSPRGRGKLDVVKRISDSNGSIPAWAGETRAGGWREWTRRVYPRVGGGNSCVSSPNRNSRGLSPRGRGKHAALAAVPAPERSIPAWAGETAGAVRLGVGGEVYPRVGGGNHHRRGQSIRLVGLSPRGRGKPEQCAPLCGWGRSIPAWAGETGSVHRQRHNRAVYPRVGGGNVLPKLSADVAGGLSPRGRGKRRTR